MKLLIADDEYLILKGMESIAWDTLGITVCGTAQSGEEALKIAEREKPDIILSDIKMPGMDGIEMACRLIQKNPGCIIIFLSGYSDFSYAQSAIRLGACDYLLKPTSPEEILNCVSQAIIRKGSPQNHAEEAANFLQGIPEKQENPIQNVSLSESVDQILNFIKQNYQKDISLSVLAQEFHFNPIYINRILKKETGNTFLDILNKIRLEKAAQLLSETDMRISEIAYQVGVCDQRYFSQVFKKAFNCTPVQFRQMALKEKNK